jgi:hypothetical protein
MATHSDRVVAPISRVEQDLLLSPPSRNNGQATAPSGCGLYYYVYYQITNPNRKIGSTLSGARNPFPPDDRHRKAVAGYHHPGRYYIAPRASRANTSAHHPTAMMSDTLHLSDARMPP